MKRMEEMQKAQEMMLKKQEDMERSQVEKLEVMTKALDERLDYSARECSKVLNQRRHTDATGGKFQEKKRLRAEAHQASGAAASVAPKHMCMSCGRNEWGWQCIRWMRRPCCMLELTSGRAQLRCPQHQVP